MQKALISLACVLVCLAAASVAWYFSMYLPRAHDADRVIQQSKIDLESTQRCNADSLKFSSNYRLDMASFLPESRSWSWNDPEMHFSKKRNTCLVEVGWSYLVKAGYVDRTNVVLDIYSNSEVVRIDYAFVDGKERVELSSSGLKSSEQYRARKEKLFTE